MKIWKSFSRVILKGYMKIVYGLFMKNIQAATDIGIIRQASRCFSWWRAWAEGAESVKRGKGCVWFSQRRLLLIKLSSDINQDLFNSTSEATVASDGDGTAAFFHLETLKLQHRPFLIQFSYPLFTVSSAIFNLLFTSVLKHYLTSPTL